MAGHAVEIPLAGGDDLFAKYFAEVTLDCVEEEIFRKRCLEEAGPRYVHLRRSAIGTVTVPPHVEGNKPEQACTQDWTGHPKVDRTLFIMDRRAEHQQKQTNNIATQKQVPLLRSAVGNKHFGTKLRPEPFTDTHRAKRMNGPKRPPYATLPPTYMDVM
eukprot:TRINITY_DN4791_c0_g1_i1.p1 TRINITY_DN4791_c0_g1~~TRINITY_DN4791_c0_g1_i1.p1  ORF type:complete len:159 (+),score=35.04 TRINITY_DN4791_c0_g1_i1:123-599(+)